MGAARFVVQAVQREGYSGSWRAGRFWPASAQTEVEVVEVPEAPDPSDPAKKLEAGRDPEQKKDAEVLQIGTNSFKKLQEDPNLRVVPKGDALAMARASSNVDELQKQVERLTLENQRLQDELNKARSHRGKRGDE